MQSFDILVILIYMAMLLMAGVFLRNKMTDSSEMFAAGRKAPWWISGISTYMTMFSAGTFVVWGGIAYDFGFVAISISLCYGFAAILVGMFLAGKWREMGLRTPAEYIELRFGKGVFHFYTWYKLIVILFTNGLTLYGLAVILCPLMPLAEGNILRDPQTGNLSVDLACIILAAIVIAYTMFGGLWAVLITDNLQFFVLMVAVIIVVPLGFIKLGSVGEFFEKVPEGFLKPTGGDYSWFFLLGWMLTNLMILGGEWQFMQRYFCVPTRRDAKKSCYLFAVLYLTTPFLWMLPPMIYRILQPGANSEEAYILMCKTVLPVGMIGLMAAAMFSATASLISSLLNVNASVLTDDVYKRLIRPNASEKEHHCWNFPYCLSVKAYCEGERKARNC